MKLRNIILLLVIFSFIGLLYIRPAITGFAVQDRFLVHNVSVSAEEFNQEIKIEQFDDYEIKMDNALYYFTAKTEKEQAIKYLLLEFEADNTQLGEFNNEDVSLYFYKDGWIKSDTELVKQYGRYNYYEAKGQGFGLYAVALRKEEKQEIITPAVNKNDLILFGLVPIFAILILFSLFSYGFVKLIQKINYRIYLFLKRGFIGIVKFGLSFGIVVLILGILSPEQGTVNTQDIMYYAFIPVLILSLLSDLILNAFLWVHRKIEYSHVYKFLRNSFWMFVSGLVLISGALIWLTPKSEGSLSRTDLILYGLVPIIGINFIFILAVYMLYILLRKVWQRND